MGMAPTACLPAEICVSRSIQGKHDYNFLRDHRQLSSHGGDDLSQSRLAAKDLVMNVLKQRAAEVEVDHCDPGDEDAFYVTDMGEIYRQHLRWKLNLGRVKPFYGMSRSTGWHFCRLIY
jgi:ornithine decarboxylase